MFSGFKTLFDKHRELRSVKSTDRPTFFGLSLYLVGLGSLVILYCLHYEGINCVFDSYCRCTSNSYCPPPYTLRTPVPFFEGGFWLDVLLWFFVIPIGWTAVVAWKSKDALTQAHVRWVARTYFFSVALPLCAVVAMVPYALLGLGMWFLMKLLALGIAFLAAVLLIWIIYREVYGLFNYVLGKEPRPWYENLK